MKSNQEFLDSVYQKVDRAREEERLKKKKIRKVYKWAGSLAACLVIGVFALGAGGFLSMGGSSSEYAVMNAADSEEAMAVDDTSQDQSLDAQEYNTAGSLEKSAVSASSSESGSDMDRYYTIREVISSGNEPTESDESYWYEEDDLQMISDWLDSLSSDQKLTEDEFTDRYTDSCTEDYVVVTDESGTVYYIFDSVPPVISE